MRLEKETRATCWRALETMVGFWIFTVRKESRVFLSRKSREMTYFKTTFSTLVATYNLVEDLSRDSIEVRDDDDLN